MHSGCCQTFAPAVAGPGSATVVLESTEQRRCWRTVVQLHARNVRAVQIGPNQSSALAGTAAGEMYLHMIHSNDFGHLLSAAQRKFRGESMRIT